MATCSATNRRWFTVKRRPPRCLIAGVAKRRVGKLAMENQPIGIMPALTASHAGTGVTVI